MNVDLSNMQVALLVALILWDLVWKAVALWRAAHRHQPYWFAALLILNTAGFLPIIYLLWTSMKEGEEATRLQGV